MELLPVTCSSACGRPSSNDNDDGDSGDGGSSDGGSPSRITL